MACRLVGAKPLSIPVLGYCQLDPRNNLRWIFYQNTNLFIQENASENIVCKKAAILSRGRWVNKAYLWWVLVGVQPSAASLLTICQAFSQQLLQRRLHLVTQPTQPYLHLWRDLHLSFQRHHFSSYRLHGEDMFAAVIKLHRMDASEQLLEMGLDDLRVGGLTQDLQQVIISDEVETWELGSFLLQKLNSVSEMTDKCHVNSWYFAYLILS